MDLDQILFKQHPLINKRAKWKLGDIFNFEKLEPPTYLTLLCKSYFFNVSYLSLYFIFFIIFFIICKRSSINQIYWFKKKSLASNKISTIFQISKIKVNHIFERFLK